MACVIPNAPNTSRIGNDVRDTNQLTIRLGRHGDTRDERRDGHSRMTLGVGRRNKDRTGDSGFWFIRDRTSRGRGLSGIMPRVLRDRVEVRGCRGGASVVSVCGSRAGRGRGSRTGRGRGSRAYVGGRRSGRRGCSRARVCRVRRVRSRSLRSVFSY